MPTKTFYLLNTAAVAPNYWGNMQDGGSAPAAASCTYGWTVAKTVVTSGTFRARLGANALATVGGTVTSGITNTLAPRPGTAATNTAAGDSFVVGPLNGSFAAGNWTFNWQFRTAAATTVGYLRMRVWKGSDPSGAGATDLSPSGVPIDGASVTMSSITTSYNSSMTWNAPAITLNNEYLFFEVEWRETTAGTSNQSGATFRQGESSIVTTNFTFAAISFPAATNLAVSQPVVGGGLGPLWQPIELGTNLQSWLDASDASTVTVTGSGVSQWRDKSSFARHGNQTTDANRPPYLGGNVIKFQSLDALTFTGNPSGSYDCCFAGLQAAGATNKTIFFNTSAEIPLRITSTGQVGVVDGGVFSQAGTATWEPDNEALCYFRLANGIPTYVAMNGGGWHEAAGMPTRQILSIGRTDASEGFGDLYEIVLLPYESSDADRQKLEGYMAWKWGLAQYLLDDAHPYKSAAPRVGGYPYPTLTEIGPEVLTASDLSVAAPVLGAPNLAELLPSSDLTAISFAISALVISTSTLGQAHKLQGNAAAAGAPSFITATIKQAHAFQAQPVTAGLPVIGSSAVSLTVNVTVSSLAVPSPSFGTPAMVPIILLSPIAYATPPPALVAATLGQKHVLAAPAFTPTSPPALAAASITQKHVLTASAIAVGSPSLGVGTASVASLVLTAVPVAASNPAFTIPALQQKHVLAGASAAAGSPALGAGILGLTANSFASSSPTLTAPSLGQRHAFTATALALAAPSLAATTLGQSGVLACIPIAITPPTLSAGVLAQKHVLAANSLAISAPAPAAATLKQVHALTTASLAVTAPSLGACALGQSHVLGTLSLAAGAPVLAAAVLGQAGVMAALPITVSSPVIGSANFSQKHSAVASSFATSAPSLSSPSLGKVLSVGALAVGAPALGAPSLAKALTAAPLAAGAPALGTPSLTAVVACVADALATTTPAIGTPALKQVHKLVAVITIGPPVLSVPTLGIIGVVIAVPAIAGAPVLGAPALGQRHVLSAAGASTGAPTIAAPACAIRVGLTAQPLAVAPVLGAPKLEQIHQLTAANLAGSAPAIGTAFFGQAGVMAAVPLWIGPLIVSIPNLRQRHRFTENVLAAGAPVLGAAIFLPRLLSAPLYAGHPEIGTPALGQQHALQPVSLADRAPSLGAAFFSQAGILAAVPLETAPAAFSAPAIGQRYKLSTPILQIGGPEIGAPQYQGVNRLPRAYNLFAGRFKPLPAVLGQVHPLTPQNASAGRPTTLLAPSLAEVRPLDPLGVEVGPPSLDAPACGLWQPRPGDVVDVIGCPHRPTIEGRRGGATITAKSQRAADITGQRNGGGRIIGRKQRVTI